MGGRDESSHSLPKLLALGVCSEFHGIRPRSPALAGTNQPPICRPANCCDRGNSKRAAVFLNRAKNIRNRSLFVRANTVRGETMADLAQKIAVQLPYLRRYARALSGSQTRGDE